jgi:cell division protein FtsN
MITTSTMPTPAAISGSRHLVKSWTGIIRLLLAASVLALLGGCSAIKLAYNNLPDLGYWWVDGYADLNEVQSLQLRADLASLHTWHRKNELPRIAELLQQMQKSALADATPEQVCSLYGDIRNRIDAVVTQAEPGALALAMRLTPAQLQHLQARFDKGNKEWRRTRVTAERSERLDKRLASEVDRAEDFYGTLGERQRKVLQDAIAVSSMDPQRMYTERLRRQQDMVATLRAIAPGLGAPAMEPAQAMAALRGYWERTVRSPDPLYRSQAEAAVQENCATYARLHNSTTPEQRARAAARLAAYARDARELAAQR